MAIQVEYEELPVRELRAGYETADATPPMPTALYSRGVGPGYEAGVSYGPGRRSLVSRMLGYFATHPSAGVLSKPPPSADPRRAELEEREWGIYWEGLRETMARRCAELERESWPTASNGTPLGGGWLRNARARLRLLEAMIAMEVHR